MSTKVEDQVSCLLGYAIDLYSDTNPNLGERQLVAEAIKKAEEASSCIVELPLLSRCVKLGCKETGIRYYADEKELAFISSGDSCNDDEARDDWTERGAFQAAPPRTRPYWKRFFRALEEELKEHPTKIGKELLDLCCY